MNQIIHIMYTESAGSRICDASYAKSAPGTVFTPDALSHSLQAESLREKLFRHTLPEVLRLHQTKQIDGQT